MAEDTATPPMETHGTAIWTWRLWGLSRRRLDVALTVLTVAVLAATRFWLLASGPWEWDETLFARGVLHFDIRAHFPHPPGFPLWIVLGKAVFPFVSSSLQGLQILSAAASCAMLWPLAALGRKVATAAVATATATAILFAPGVWLHAVRGFSSTPATFFALWAGALAVYGLAGRRATAFTVLLACAFLIRPILLPPLGLLWLFGASTVRPRRRLLPGIAFAAAATVASVVGMVVAQGSWASFVAPFIIHGRTHARGLASNAAAFHELGLVKGVGGTVFAVTLVVLAVLGTVVWARRTSRRTAGAWLLVLAAATAELVFLQNRTYTRYAVPVQVAVAPLVAGAAGLAAPPAAVGAILGLGVVWAADAYPLLEEQHAAKMPGWEALEFAVREAKHRHVDIVVEPGLYPFLSYLRESDRARGVEWPFEVYLAPASPDADEYPEGDYIVVTDVPERYLPAPVGRRVAWDHVSPELEPLTQERFLRAEVLEGVPLLVDGWWVPETTADGVTFAWGGPRATMIVPPYPGNPRVSLDIRPAGAPTPVLVAVDGTPVAAAAGTVPRTSIALPAEAVPPGRAVRVTFTRSRGYPPGPNDQRPLALRLYGVGVATSHLPWTVEAADLAKPRLSGVELVAASPVVPAAVQMTGFHGIELFGDRLGAWTLPEASVRFPAGVRALSLTVSAPRPTSAALTVEVDGTPLIAELDVPRRPTTLFLAPPPSRHATTMVALRAAAYSPAAAGAGTDSRTLGVVVHEMVARPQASSAVASVRVEPRPDRTGWAATSALPCVYPPEHFGTVLGAWTRPECRLEAPIGPGHLLLTAWAARPTPAGFEVRAGNRVLLGPVDLSNQPTVVDVRIPDDVGGAPVVLSSDPYQPIRHGGRDRRMLGVVISRIEFRPRPPLP